MASGNLGCMLQLAPRLPVPVTHAVQLLDWATGGPRPPGI
jgi:glycolate oxidase iron-sulfur subunit